MLFLQGVFSAKALLNHSLYWQCLAKQKYDSRSIVLPEYMVLSDDSYFMKINYLFTHRKFYSFQYSFFLSDILSRSLALISTYYPHANKFNVTMCKRKQECIPVGCVPPAHWPYCLFSASQGVVWPGLTRGWCDQVWPGGWPGLTGGGGWPLPIRPGTYSPSDHVTYPMMHLMSPPPPLWPEWVTHTWEDITFARFATRVVIIMYLS